MSRHYTSAEKEKAKSLWSTGLSIKNVAKEVGCSPESVKSWRKGDLAGWNDARESVSNELKEKIQEAAATLVPLISDARLSKAPELIEVMEQEVTNAKNALTPKERSDALTNIQKASNLLDAWGMFDVLKTAMMREAANTASLGHAPEETGPGEVEVID